MDLLHSYAACCNPLRHPHFPTLNRLVVGSIPTASTTSQFSSQLSYDTILLDGKGKTIVASA